MPALDSAIDIYGVSMPAWCLWLVGFAAVVTAVGTIYRKALVPVFRVGKAVHATYERVEGYDKRLSALEDNTKQLTRNSGSHLADAVYRIEAAQTDMRADFQAEILKLWQTIAARDVVDSAAKTGEVFAGKVDAKNE